LIIFLRNKRLKIYHRSISDAFWNLMAGAVLACVLGFMWAAFLSHQRLERSLSSDLEGVDLLVTGIVDSLPSSGTQGIRLSLAVESVVREDLQQPVDLESFPQRLSLGWYPGWRQELEFPEIKPGQRWRLPVRLKKPHGLMNPHGFDFERWMFQQSLGATGAVRAGAKGLPRSWKPRLLDELVPSFTSYVELARWHLRERIKSAAPEGAQYVGVLMPLLKAIGDYLTRLGLVI
jgi:competence protein ComEC